MAETRSPMRNQSVLQWTQEWKLTFGLLLLSYSMLIPGVLMDHVHFKYSLGPKVLLEDSYGIVRIIKLLWHAGGFLGSIYKLVGGFIALWGICIPMVKLGTLLAFLTGYSRSRFGVEVVCKVSKWAFVDAFIPVIWASVWSSPGVLGSVHAAGAEAVIELKPGIYLYIIHLVLAQLVNHLVLLLPTDDASLPLYGLNTGESEEKQINSSRHFHAASAFGICTLLLIAVAWPVMGFQSNLFGVEMNVSVLNLAVWLNLAKLWLPAMVVTLFAVACPISDLILGFLKVTAGVNLPQTLFWVETFAMFDVFMTGIAISCLTCDVFFGQLTSMRLTTVGSLAWLFYTAWAFIALFRPSHVDANESPLEVRPPSKQ